MSTIAILAAAGLLAAALFVWSGIYPVGADRDHLGVTTWLLERVREQSIDTYSAGIEAPPLGSHDLASLGAAHYEGGCVPCHGRPGAPIHVIVAEMLPPPPPLAEAMTDRDEPEEVFWIVKHGLKYTGMPAWPAQIRDDEVWALAAFLGRVRANGPGRMASYPGLAGIDRLEGGRPATGEILEGTPLTQCSRCHDDAGLPTLASLVPRLAGQSEAYLRRAMREYAAGSRPSGIMQPVAGAFAPAAIDRLAAFYAGLRPPGQPATGADPDSVERGRQLAGSGDPERDVPPCLACHGNARFGSFPALAGQNADYIVSQLQLWARGGRSSTTHGAIMAPIARRLTEQQMRDAAAYFAQQPREPLRSPAAEGDGS